MIKNNIYALLSYWLIWIFLAIFYHPAKDFRSLGIYIDAFMFLVGLGLYFLSGYFLQGKILSAQKGPIRNLVSIFSIALISLGLWIYCSINSDGDVLSKVTWLYYFHYNLYTIPLAMFTQKWVKIYDWLWNVKIIFSFIPVLFIWLGMEIKIAFTKKNTTF